MLYFIIAVAIIIGYKLFQRKKKMAPTQTVLTDTQKQLIDQHIDYYHKLSDTDKLYFEDRVKQFLDAVNIEGVGLEINDTDRIMIASSAVIPIFAFNDWTYRNVTNVLLYPDTFDKDFQFEGNEG